MSAPVGHTLYALMDRVLSPLRPRVSGAIMTILQLVIANLIISPIQNYVYLYALAYISGKRDHQEIDKIVRAQLPGVNKVTWQVAPLVQILTFKFVPQTLWIPVFNLVGLVFGIVFNVLSKKPKQGGKK